MRSHLWLLSLSVLVLACLPLQAQSRAARARSASDACAAEIERVRALLTARFGIDLQAARVPERIRSEAAAVLGEKERLSGELGSLEARARELDSREFILRTDEESNQRRSAELDRELEQLNEQAASIGRQLAENEGRRLVHNQNPPDDTDAEAVRRYNAAAEAGNAERNRLIQEDQALKARLRDLAARRERLDMERGRLFGRRQELDQALAGLETRINQFAAACHEAESRARALAEIAPAAGQPSITVAPAGPRPAPAARRPAPAEPLQSMAKETGFHLVDQLAPLLKSSPRIMATASGVASVAVGADILMSERHAAVDERTREVENNLLILGDYGAALHRLKQEGRLRPEDPGYQALTEMLRIRGEESPRTKADLLLTTPSVRSLLTGLAAVGGQYVSRRVKELDPGARLLRKLSAEELAVLGTNGSRLFRRLISGQAEVSSSVLSEEAANLATKSVAEQLERSRQRRAMQR